MKELGFLKNMGQPKQAEGKVKIELTDPVTGKVKERICGENHAFLDSISSATDLFWHTEVSKVWLCLNDSTRDIDTELPYLFGNTIGYGVPSTGSSGNYQGAYNVANQVLAEKTVDSIRWVFQYDFTTAQANSGTISTIGLTHQYRSFTIGNSGVVPLRQLKGFSPVLTNNTYGMPCDGRYAYVCSSVGIVTVYDNYLNTSNTIDISSVVGSVSSTKNVGYNPVTGRFYIYVYSSTAANRKMYEFSDSTFSTLLNTFSVSNFTINSGSPMYVYGTKAFWFNASYNTLHIGDFSANTAVIDRTITEKSSLLAAPSKVGQGTCALKGSIIAAGLSAPYSQGYTSGFFFDLSSETVIGYINSISGSSDSRSSPYKVIINPVTSEKIITLFGSTFDYFSGHNAAITVYKLETPVTKTSANGMTVTYELEVFW